MLELQEFASIFFEIIDLPFFPSFHLHLYLLEVVCSTFRRDLDPYGSPNVRLVGELNESEMHRPPSEPKRATAIERALGNELPIAVGGWHLAERRELSRRWLAGIALTGVISSILMGAALLGALQGSRQRAVPAEAYVPSEVSHKDHGLRKAGRATKTLVRVLSTNRTVLEAPTITKDGEREIVRRQLFAYVRMGLETNSGSPVSYPAFDPLAISVPKTVVVDDPSSGGYLYASDVESELQLKRIPMGLLPDAVAFAPGLTVNEAENAVRSNGAVLVDEIASSATVYVDSLRFDDGQMEGFGSVEFTAKILEANVTTTEATPTTPQTEQFADYIVTVGEQGSIERALVSIGYPLQRSKLVAAYLAPKLMGSDLDVGDYLRIGVIQRSDKIEVVRASAYRGAKHLATVAIDDDGRFVSAAEPEAVDAIANSTALDEPIKRVGAAARVYDGIYRAALSYGMTMEMATEMVGCLAPAIDFLAPVKPTDRIDAFFSVEEKAASFGTPSQLLFVSAHLGDVDTRLYRYRDPLTGKSGYYDQDGKSIQQALLRNPVPSASSNSNSSYGMRQHPVLGFARMHTGVDYAAASGTPIVSSGAGVVVRAGWDTGGYGNQTVIRHSGGYVSSYSHQSAIAEGLKPGRRVKQGEVIGYVGSTGMATGAHLHYELSVNGNRVNPLRARLPVGQSLQGTVLTNFLKERQKIDALIASPLARAPSNT